MERGNNGGEKKNSSSNLALIISLKMTSTQDQKRNYFSMSLLSTNIKYEQQHRNRKMLKRKIGKQPRMSSTQGEKLKIRQRCNYWYK